MKNVLFFCYSLLINEYWLIYHDSQRQHHLGSGRHTKAILLSLITYFVKYKHVFYYYSTT